MPKLFPFGRSRPAAADFQQLLRPHVDFLHRLAYRFTGAAADAEDLVQDTLIKLLPHTNEMRAVQQLRPWLARVLYRQFIDSLRRRGRSPLDAAAADESDGDPLAQLPAAGDGPEDSFDHSLRQEHLLHALGQLAPEQRAVLTLHDVEGYRLEELEEVLETPLGTLKSRLHRARARLRGLLSVEPFSPRERVKG